MRTFIIPQSYAVFGKELKKKVISHLHSKSQSQDFKSCAINHIIITYVTTFSSLTTLPRNTSLNKWPNSTNI